MKDWKEASTMEKYDFERPDYKRYISRMKEREKVEPKLSEPELHTR